MKLTIHVLINIEILRRRPTGPAARFRWALANVVLIYVRHLRPYSLRPHPLLLSLINPIQMSEILKKLQSSEDVTPNSNSGALSVPANRTDVPQSINVTSNDAVPEPPDNIEEAWAVVNDEPPQPQGVEMAPNESGMSIIHP